MRAYGLPRQKDIEFPDMADIRYYGLKSSIGNIARKSGEFRSLIKNASQKKVTRRFWKRRARRESKLLCFEIV